MRTTVCTLVGRKRWSIGGSQRWFRSRASLFGIELLHNLRHLIGRIFKAAIRIALACCCIQSCLIKPGSQALRYLRAYRLQTHEMLFDAHNHAFVVLGGVPRRGIYDNMRTAVDRVRRGKERDVNARFAAMVSHFLFEAEFCNPASGWEKCQVEKNVRDARHRLWQVVPPFQSLPDLNACSK